MGKQRTRTPLVESWFSVFPLLTIGFPATSWCLLLSYKKALWFGYNWNQSSRSLLLGIIFFTNFLDYLLLTAVVPIIPEFLVDADRKNVEGILKATNQTIIAENDTDIYAVGNSTSHGSKNNSMESFIEKILHVPVRAINENSRVGWLLSSKALVQMIANPLVGGLTGRIRYRSMLVFGTCVFLTSATIFAAAESYIPLLVARASQGFGSAATTIAGMSMLAESYPDDQDRSRAMGTAMSGLALGILVGYPFGGLLYALAGKALPFIGIAVLCLFNIVLQLGFLDSQDVSTRETVMGLYSFYKLLTDPYILICAGAIMITSMSLAVLESTVPIWIIDVMDAKQWQLGLIFIPDSVGYLLGTNLFPVTARKFGRWRFTIASLLMIGVGMILIPISIELYHLLIPHLALGLGVGITDAAIMPLLALLVDQRHVVTYGSVYAIVQLAVCLAYFLGPAAAAEIVKAYGFKWCMWGVAALNLLMIPPCVFLRSPPVVEDQQCLLNTLTGEDHSIDADESRFQDLSFKYQTFEEISDYSTNN